MQAGGLRSRRGEIRVSICIGSKDGDPVNGKTRSIWQARRGLVQRGEIRATKIIGGTTHSTATIEMKARSGLKLSRVMSQCKGISSSIK